MLFNGKHYGDDFDIHPNSDGSLVRLDGWGVDLRASISMRGGHEEFKHIVWRKLDDVRSRMSDIVAQRVANRAETMQARAKKKVEREVSARVAGSADEMQRLRNENEQLRRQLELAHAVEAALRTSADEKSREIEKLERASQQREARYDPRNMQRVEV